MDPVPPLLSLSLAAFTFVVVLLFLLHKHPKPKLPPGPRTLPLIGSIHHVIGDLPHRRLLQLSHRHGAPLLHLKLGQLHYIIASSSDTAREILKTHDLSFSSRPSLMIIKTIAYSSAGLGFSPYGPYWRQLRKISAVELLSTRRVKSFASVRQDEATKLITELQSAAAAGSTVNLSKIFLALTNNHLTRAAFGKECPSRDRFLRAMKETIRLAPVLSLMDLFPSFGFLISKVDGSMRKMKRLHEELDGILDEIVEEHMRRRRGGVEIEEDLVDVLLRVKEKEELEIPLTTLDVKAVVLDMLVAATETTTSTLEWVLSELIRHPEIMREAQLEIREALRGKTTIEESDVDEFHYLKRVIKETLRLHPPLPLLLPRTCNESVELLGYNIPSKSRVMINAWAIARDPKLWEDPESFLPDRFKESSIDFKGGSFEYIPFGAGRRICPGMTFALAGMEFFLAVLLFHFNWELPGGRSPKELDMDEEFDGSLRRKHELCLLVVPYNSSLEN